MNMRLSNPISGPVECIAGYLAVIPVIKASMHIQRRGIVCSPIALLFRPTSEGNIEDRQEEKEEKRKSKDV